MKTSNLANGAIRQSEVGCVWLELYAPGTSGTLSITVPPLTTLRISAGAATAVTLDGVASITLRANEVEIINVGTGIPGNNTRLVTVGIVSTDVAVQQAVDGSTGRYNP